ncbi:MAG TPA: hypothetical protein VJA87_02135 [Candidatus Paceibacterota bacterium]
MNSVKYDLMVKEFPFIATIMRQQCLNADGIEHILVRKADENLLEVEPYYHSCEPVWDHMVLVTHSRLFWSVTEDGAVQQLRYSIDAETGSGHATVTKVESIGYQLVRSRPTNIRFVVELNGDDEYDDLPNLTIYKLKGLEWEEISWRRWRRKEWELPRASA